MILTSDFLLLGSGLLFIRIIIAFVQKKSPHPLWSLSYIYIIIVLGVTLFPIPYQEAGSLMPVPNNFIPLDTIRSVLRTGITRNSLVQICGNILLPVPYGVALYLVVRGKLPRIISPLLFPLTIELLQLFIGMAIGLNYRSFDIDDFILNLLGVYLGHLLGQIFLKKHRDNIYRYLFPSNKT